MIIEGRAIRTLAELKDFVDTVIPMVADPEKVTISNTILGLRCFEERDQRGQARHFITATK